jgi:hypothetical protein
MPRTSVYRARVLAWFFSYAGSLDVIDRSHDDIVTADLLDELSQLLPLG